MILISIFNVALIIINIISSIIYIMSQDSSDETTHDTRSVCNACKKEICTDMQYVECADKNDVIVLNRNKVCTLANILVYMKNKDTCRCGTGDIIEGNDCITMVSAFDNDCKHRDQKYSFIVQKSGIFKFDWNYVSNVSCGAKQKNGKSDPFLYSINDHEKKITNNDCEQHGSLSLRLHRGNKFCFIQRSNDSRIGCVQTTITNFAYTFSTENNLGITYENFMTHNKSQLNCMKKSNNISNDDNIVIQKKQKKTDHGFPTCNNKHVPAWMSSPTIVLQEGKGKIIIDTTMTMISNNSQIKYCFTIIENGTISFKWHCLTDDTNNLSHPFYCTIDDTYMVLSGIHCGNEIVHVVKGQTICFIQNSLCATTTTVDNLIFEYDNIFIDACNYECIPYKKINFECPPILDSEIFGNTELFVKKPTPIKVTIQGFDDTPYSTDGWIQVRDIGTSIVITNCKQKLILLGASTNCHTQTSVNVVEYKIKTTKTGTICFDFEYLTSNTTNLQYEFFEFEILDAQNNHIDGFKKTINSNSNCTPMIVPTNGTIIFRLSSNENKNFASVHISNYIFTYDDIENKTCSITVQQLSNILFNAWLTNGNITTGTNDPPQLPNL